MPKKIRLLDDVEETTESEAVSGMTGDQTEKLLKYAEAIDWKLWEIYNLLKENTDS